MPSTQQQAALLVKIRKHARRKPVDMHFAEQIRDEVAYQLPAGVRIQRTPPDAIIPRSEYEVLAIGTEAGHGDVTVTRSFTRAFAKIKPEEYPQLLAYLSLAILAKAGCNNHDWFSL
jgi:hypothetical protein